LYLVALYALLTLPDICGALDSPNGQATGARATGWMQTNGGANAQHAALLYKFRCTMLHQASGAAQGHMRVAFVEPGGPVEHRLVTDRTNVGEGVYVWFDIPQLVDEVVGSVRNWLTKNRAVPPVATNLPNTVHRHVGGLGSHLADGTVYA
jgi:hypothetical protein